MKTALILVDIQNDYFEGGRNELFQTTEAAMKAASVLKYFRDKQMLVIHVQHINQGKNPGFFAPDTEGVKINQLVAPLESEKTVIKHAPDSFLKTELKAILDQNEITNLVVCGMMTHMCIDTTVRTAKHLGYQTTLIEDACTTRDLVWNNRTVRAMDVQAAYMSPLNDCFAKVISADEWLAENN